MVISAVALDLFYEEHVDADYTGERIFSLPFSKPWNLSTDSKTLEFKYFVGYLPVKNVECYSMLYEKFLTIIYYIFKGI